MIINTSVRLLEVLFCWVQGNSSLSGVLIWVCLCASSVFLWSLW
jgi:hypothetical protein